MFPFFDVFLLLFACAFSFLPCGWSVYQRFCLWCVRYCLLLLWSSTWGSMDISPRQYSYPSNVRIPKLVTDKGNKIPLSFPSFSSVSSYHDLRRNSTEACRRGNFGLTKNLSRSRKFCSVEWCRGTTTTTTRGETHTKTILAALHHDNSCVIKRLLSSRCVTDHYNTDPLIHLIPCS